MVTTAFKLAIGICFLVLAAACGDDSASTGDAGLAAADAGDGAGKPEGPGAEYVFDDAKLGHFEVRVDPTEWERIQRFPVQEEYIQGSLEYEGQIYEPIALRFKGFRGSLYNCFDCCSVTDTKEECPELGCYDAAGMLSESSCPQLSMKVSFTEYDEEPEFFGLRRLNFHAVADDVSMLRERLAYWLYRESDVPAPRAVHATLSVNGEPRGLFTLVEQIDSAFARDNFDDGGEGNVYKERWPTLSTAADYYRSGLESNKGPDTDVSAMVELARALEGATETSIVSILEERTDLDRLARHVAIDRATAHWDGIMSFRCDREEDLIALPPDVLEAQRPALGFEVCQNKNYYWYEDARDGRLTLVPWDTDGDLRRPFVDQTMMPWYAQNGECIEAHWDRPALCDPLLALLATTLKDRIIAAGRKFVAGPYAQAEVEKMLRRWQAQIEPAAAEAGTDAETLGAAIDILLSHVEDLRAAFEAELDGWP